MKNVLLLIFLLNVFIIVGCQSQLFKESMATGKMALSEEDYRKAVEAFSTALQEDTEDQEAQEMLKIAQYELGLETEYIDKMEVFEQGKKYLEEKKYEKAIGTFSSLASYSGTFEPIQKLSEESRLLLKETKKQQELSLSPNVNVENGSFVVREIQLDMKRSEVLKKLGEPDSIKNENSKDTSAVYEVFSYPKLEIYFYNEYVRRIYIDIDKNIQSSDWYKKLGTPSTGVGTEKPVFYLTENREIAVFDFIPLKAWIEYPDNTFYFYLFSENDWVDNAIPFSKHLYLDTFRSAFAGASERLDSIYGNQVRSDFYNWRPPTLTENIVSGSTFRLYTSSENLILFGETDQDGRIIEIVISSPRYTSFPESMEEMSRRALEGLDLLFAQRAIINVFGINDEKVLNEWGKQLKQGMIGDKAYSIGNIEIISKENADYQYTSIHVNR